MPPSSTPLCFKICLAWLLAWCCAAAQARSLSLAAERLHDPHVDATGLSIELAETSANGTLRIRVSRLDIPALALAGRVDWECSLERRVDGTRRCAGRVMFSSEANTTRDAQLTATLDGEHLEILFARDDREARVTLPFSNTATSAVQLKGIPADWLKAPIARVWTGGEFRGGVIDLDAGIDSDGSLSARYTATGLSINSTDGAAAGEGMNVTGRFAWTKDGTASHARVDATFTGGSLLMGAVHMRLPDTAIEIGVDATLRDDGLWSVDRFAWNDPGTLVFEASALVAPAETAPLRSLGMRVDLARFPAASGRYVTPILEGSGLAQIALRGDLAGRFSFDGPSLGELSLSTSSLDVEDARTGIAVKGLHGAIDWAAVGNRPEQMLGWGSATIGGVTLSAATTRWAAKQGALRSQGALRVKMLGGAATLTRIVVSPLSNQPERLRSDFSLRGVGYDSADGRIAASGVNVDGHLSVASDAQGLRLQSDSRFRGGEFLADPVYVKLPDTPVSASIDARGSAGVWHVERFDWADPGTLEFRASADIAPGDGKPLRTFRVDLQNAMLKPAVDRYAQAWLTSRGYADLHASGSLTGSIVFDQGRLQHVAVAAHAVDLRDAAGRFTLADIDGGIDWDALGDAPATTLAWRSLEFYRVPFGAMSASLQSREGRVLLTAPVDIGVLGGKVRIEKLSLQPDSPRGERYAGSFAIGSIDMTQLSSALGWPKFPGNLSGGIPEIEFVGDRIELHGGLDLYVFDGHLGISGMSLEHPFGELPALAADVHFENFDLQQLTSAFSFGGMSGRLAGTIDRLSLLNWSPVAFDAWMRTAGGGRMSYKAISDVTAVAGGGGLSDNVQTLALKLVNTFSYGRLGLRCRLANNVCTMGGIDPVPADRSEKTAGDDYTIVEGAGLPRISIVGHRRRVDWPTLVRRLDAAVQGQTPVIQ
ncbi:MAG: hypothetical protein ABIR62_06735 [Dokdonella sp.]|uniref:hypothetical protein n=1 Tax=Dokdonella sp. TaxID=2291710 RepID=UPI0032672090